MLTFVALVLIVALFVRIQRLQRELDQLKHRVDALDRLAVPKVLPPTVARPPVAAPPARPAPSQFDRSPATVAAQTEPTTPVLPPLAADANDETLEGRIGGRLMLYAGMIVLVLGVAFFLRHAFENEWISPVVRVVVGAAGGLALVAGGLRLARTYRPYGLFLAGGGVAVLYLSVYAAVNLYLLLGSEAGFALFVIITAAAAVLADRADSLALAVVAVCGGFATPFLVGGSRDAQVTLFSYVALLVAATMYLAHRRAWPWLNVLSMTLTGVTCASWLVRFYTPSRYVATELFITLYCAMFLAILRDTYRSTRPEPGRRAHRDARLVSLLLVTAPVAYYLTSLLILSPHAVPFLVYLIVVTVLTVIAAVHFDSAGLRLVAWIAVALPLAGWIDVHQSRAWTLASVVTAFGIFAVHLAAQARACASRRELSRPDVVLVHANGIGLCAALYQALTPVATVPELATMALVLALVHACLWWMASQMTPMSALHWLGVALTLTAIAVTIQFDGPWAIAMWATEGAAVFWIASRTGSEWLRMGAWVLVALAAVRWLRADIQQTTTAHVVIANMRALTGLYLTAIVYAIAWLQRRETSADEPRRQQERAVVLVAASVLTVFVMSTEITSFWAVRREAVNAYVARELMLSAAWAAYAAVLVVIGIRWRYAPIRYFAIALFALTLAKVFLVDLETLGGIYRIAGFIVVGVILLLVSFLYQRTRVGRAGEAD